MKHIVTILNEIVFQGKSQSVLWILCSFLLTVDTSVDDFEAFSVPVCNEIIQHLPESMQNIMWCMRHEWSKVTLTTAKKLVPSEVMKLYTWKFLAEIEDMSRIMDMLRVMDWSAPLSIQFFKWLIGRESSDRRYDQVSLVGLDPAQHAPEIMYTEAPDKTGLSFCQLFGRLRNPFNLPSPDVLTELAQLALAKRHLIAFDYFLRYLADRDDNTETIWSSALASDDWRFARSMIHLGTSTIQRRLEFARRFNVSLVHILPDNCLQTVEHIISFVRHCTFAQFQELQKWTEIRKISLPYLSHQIPFCKDPQVIQYLGSLLGRWKLVQMWNDNSLLSSPISISDAFFDYIMDQSGLVTSRREIWPMASIHQISRLMQTGAKPFDFLEAKISVWSLNCISKVCQAWKALGKDADELFRQLDKTELSPAMILCLVQHDLIPSTMNSTTLVKWFSDISILNGALPSLKILHARCASEIWTTPPSVCFRDAMNYMALDTFRFFTSCIRKDILYGWREHFSGGVDYSKSQALGEAMGVLEHRPMPNLHTIQMERIPHWLKSGWDSLVRARHMIVESLGMSAGDDIFSNDINVHVSEVLSRGSVTLPHVGSLVFVE